VPAIKGAVYINTHSI